MTGIDHQDNPQIDEAGRWLAEQLQPPSPIVPALRARFGLTAGEACQACAIATKLRQARAAA